MNITPYGLLHSDIPGSLLVCSSPRLFAAYHVLHRLSVPRHPSCALSSLTTKNIYSCRTNFVLLNKVVCIFFNIRLIFFSFAAWLFLIIFFNFQSTAVSDRLSIFMRQYTLNIFKKPASPKLVGVPGLEPGTSSLSGTRSNQLSYTPSLYHKVRSSPYQNF